MQIGLKMEPGDFLPLNINAMCAISVKSYLKVQPMQPSEMKCTLTECVHSIHIYISV